MRLKVALYQQQSGIVIHVERDDMVEKSATEFEFKCQTVSAVDREAEEQSEGKRFNTL